MSEKQLDTLQKKRDQINARIQKIKTKEGARKRKADTAVKILLGAALLKRIGENDEKAAGLLDWCRSILTEKDQARLDIAMEKRK